jgi:hypothetical protein
MVAQYMLNINSSCIYIYRHIDTIHHIVWWTNQLNQPTNGSVQPTLRPRKRVPRFHPGMTDRVDPTHYKKHVYLWWFSHNVSRKHYKHAQSVMIIMFSSRISIIGHEAHTFMTFSQIHYKLTHYIMMFFHIRHIWINPVVFHKIYHGWRTIISISMDPPIVFWLCGMNISCWSHMSDLHPKKLFFDYQNIILCHLGGPHDTLASGWPTCQLCLGWIFF